MVVVRISVALGGQSPEECEEPLCLGRGGVLSASLWYPLTMCQGPSLHAAPGESGSGHLGHRATFMYQCK